MANDLWCTPPEVFNTLNREFGFIADMASSKHNALCEAFFTESDNHLAPSMQAYLCAMIANNAIYRMMVENRNRKGIEQK